jgi:cytochrome c biogenesis protein CcmG, thiol:disulfide interchange protein DsbE
MLSNMFLKPTLILCLFTLAAGADETLPRLTIKGQTYYNVTVTVVTATDIFFSHAAGMGNAKLKDLDPKLQEHFHYDAAKSALVEKEQATNNVLFQQFVLTNHPQSVHLDDFAAGGGGGGVDFVAPKIYARSVLGQRPPPFAVEQWLTPMPVGKGKFTMLVFWATTSDACRQTIPQLNAMIEKFHDRLVIIGISAEPAAVVRSMAYPQIEFASAIDTQANMAIALQITAVPHCILVDPHAIVRYEGMPGYLDDEKLEHFLMKYR